MAPGSARLCSARWSGGSRASPGSSWSKPPAGRATRAFYEARGYRVGGIISDFYAPGDDQVVYVKQLSPAA